MNYDLLALKIEPELNTSLVRTYGSIWSYNELDDFSLVVFVNSQKKIEIFRVKSENFGKK